MKKIGANLASKWIKNYSPVVQSVERRTVNPYVAGSSPAGGAKFYLTWLTISSKMNYE